MTIQSTSEKINILSTLEKIREFPRISDTKHCITRVEYQLFDSCNTMGYNFRCQGNQPLTNTGVVQMNEKMVVLERIIHLSDTDPMVKAIMDLLGKHGSLPDTGSVQENALLVEGNYTVVSVAANSLHIDILKGYNGFVLLRDKNGRVQTRVIIPVTHEIRPFKADLVSDTGVLLEIVTQNINWGSPERLEKYGASFAKGKSYGVKFQYELQENMTFVGTPDIHETIDSDDDLSGASQFSMWYHLITRGETPVTNGTKAELKNLRRVTRHVANVVSGNGTKTGGCGCGPSHSCPAVSILKLDNPHLKI